MLMLGLLCAGYSITIILGISFLVFLISNLYSFGGHCLLFSGGKFEDNGDFTPVWASSFACILSILLVGISIIIASIRLVRTAVMLTKCPNTNFAMAFRMTLTALLMALGSLTVGLLVSVGLSHWCSAVEERFSQGCEAAAPSLTITNNTENLDVKGFFAAMETSQFSIWSSLVVWVFILTISGCLLFMAHERANIRISMARERRRYNRPVDYANQPSNLPRRDIT